jgi:hypothetical protein
MSWGVLMAMLVLRIAQADPGVQPQEPGPQAQPEAQAHPEPQAPTRATFVSTSSQQWDVVVDGQPICGTPCTGPLFPLQHVSMHSHEPRPVVLDVGRLPPGDLIVSATPLNEGMYAGGIVATTFGGMALAVGITFTAVGLAKDRGGMTTAGLITGGAGAVTLGGGIYLMLRALPNIRVDAASPYAVGLAGRF